MRHRWINITDENGELLTRWCTNGKVDEIEDAIAHKVSVAESPEELEAILSEAEQGYPTCDA